MVTPTIDTSSWLRASGLPVAFWIVASMVSAPVPG